MTIEKKGGPLPAGPFFRGLGHDLTETEVREKLIDLLQHKIPLGEFEQWLVGESWNMHQDSTQDTQDLVSSIELLLAERSSGELSDEDFYHELRSLVDQVA